MEIKIKKIYKKAFTLAEILVTLSILGVVFAALAPTVNTFNNERADKTYKAKTGKAYSVLSESLRAKFVTTQRRMVGNEDARNLVNYITDRSSGSVKTVRVSGNAFKTQDGMVFLVRGNNCHQNACFVVVDMDGQQKGSARTIATMEANYNNYVNANVDRAKEKYSDIAVFMVKDGQVYPYTDYTADNMQMEKNTDTDLQTEEINLQFSELNLSPD